ncbi:MAG TPA: ATP-binding protein, partial [Planctomycetaceae bacterium]
ATTYYIFWLSSSHARILTDNVASIRAAGTMQESLWKLQAAFLDVINDEDAPNWTAFGEFEAQFEKSLVAGEEAAMTDAERSLVTTIREHFSEYREFIHQRVSDIASARSQAAVITDASTHMVRSVSEPCTELLQLNERLMSESVARRTALENTLNLARLVFLVAGPAIGIYVGMRMATNLHRSISQISVTLNDASGELDQEVGRVDFRPAGAPGDLTGLNRQVQLVAARIRQVLSELQNVRQEAIISERLAVVGELAAGVAHELRNPLTSLKLLIQTARRDPVGIQLEERKALVILQEILRMEETIQGLLDFARPPGLNQVRHDLRDTMRRALNLVEGRAIHEGIVIDARFPDEPVTIDADPEQLHQVFVNLLINGIDSMRNAGTLEVSAGVAAHRPSSCSIVIADRGGGIPEERLGRIFDPFVTTKEHGTGLGLAVSRRIVQAHGGTITASNRPDGGAVFSVELPLAQVSARPESDFKHENSARHEIEAVATS